MVVRERGLREGGQFQHRPSPQTPDDTLRRLFGDNLTQLHQVGERVDAHLRPLPPVTLEHTIDPVASTTGTVDVSGDGFSYLFTMPWSAAT